MAVIEQLKPTRSERWRKRCRVRRVSKAERRLLGLPGGLGDRTHTHRPIEQRELERARSYRALEMIIAREVNLAQLKPMQQVGFDGRLVTVRERNHPDSYDPGATGKAQTIKRNTSATPLDYLRWHSKGSRLEHWEYLTGKRFESDFAQAHCTGQVTQSLDVLARAKPPEKPERRKRGDPPAPVVTFKPRNGKRQQRGPIEGISDRKIDALARLGRLADRISHMSFWMLEHVIGREIWLKDVAIMLQVTPEYVATRFREALCEAAGHYRMGPSSKPREGKYG